MLSFTVRMQFDTADHELVKGMLETLTVASRQEPGCVSYIAHFVKDDPATVVIYEQYRDQAALEHHRNTPHFQQYATDGLYPRVKARQLEFLEAVL